MNRKRGRRHSSASTQSDADKNEAQPLAPIAPPPPPSPTEAAAALAKQFAEQGIQYDATMDGLWCSLCTRSVAAEEANADGCNNNNNNTNNNNNSNNNNNNNNNNMADSADCNENSNVSVVWSRVAATMADVLQHCATRTHLLQFELHRTDGLKGWCPVSLNGHRVLLDRHCIYPHHVFGPGCMVLDETIAGGMLMAEDVCGGVKLWPRHHYRAAELVLPASSSFTRSVEPPGVDVFYEVASTRTEHHKNKTSQWGQFTDVRHEGVKALPEFLEVDRGVRSARAKASNLAQVLQMTNESITGEAAMRRRRRDTFAKDNVHRE